MALRARHHPGSNAAILAVVVSLLATPAFAACTQDRAVYADRDDTYTLTFRHVPEDQPVMTSNEFTIQLNDSDVKLDGVVMWNEGVARPNPYLISKHALAEKPGAAWFFDANPRALDRTTVLPMRISFMAAPPGDLRSQERKER